MNADHAQIRALLADRGLLPPDPVALYLCGSLARGWANARSDIDVVAVVREPWQSPTAGEVRVALAPGAVPFESTDAQGRALEVKYWLEGQYRQVLEKVSWDARAGARAVHERLTPVEEGLLGRLATCVPLAGQAWIAALQADVRSSAFAALLVERTLEMAHEAIEDARGQMEAADTDSAVLSARLAFGHSVDALTLAGGEFDRSAKWRARRVRELAAPALPFERYWDFETMRGLDAQAPEAWIASLLEACELLIQTVVVRERRSTPAAQGN